ncbi:MULTISPECIES: CHAD domain-containing protein [unclassified Rhizobium]|uniref:CYTH and CHAD domain-containing protein n=1 Tax=unclassified Rhizobium TaxID=2613769 RepID=UPI0007134144|nr:MULTISPECIES: CHAD domain-containing protein [unclassified Rhizobium]KQT06775.1 metal-binding protein [Rhizobium sp. Leaf386]KQU05937.1 metal-binding protein [Rhizobium sp. Leaf453]
MTETELKLEILPADLDRLLESDLLGEPAAIIEQQSTYLDTSDHRLQVAGFSLRIRRSGDSTVQTVKATGPSASLFARSEWETKISGETPTLDHSSPLLNEFGPIANALSPQFEVVIRRRVWNLVENGSKIEAVIDTGMVDAWDRQTPITEMELELKEGTAGDLFTLARQVGAIVPFKLGMLSKAERGFRLLQPQRIASKSEPIELDRGISAHEAFQVIAGSCFRQFRINETILLERKNPEALHQARVALRRLRSAISLFKPLFPDDEARRISDEFRWLTGVLGEARNLDVLLPKADELRVHLMEARTSAYEDAVDALGSFRAKALILGFYEWLQCGEYLVVSDGLASPRGSAAEFAVAALDRQRRKLKKRGKNLAETDDDRRHEARKDAKKLRYAAEFFGSLFTDKRATRRYSKFIEAMEHLQDQLGALNDLATGPDVLDKHGLRDHPEATDLISHANKSALISKAQDALDEVLDAKPFWR